MQSASKQADGPGVARRNASDPSARPRLVALGAGDACGDAHPDTVARLADQVRTAFAHRPCVRFGEAQLAVLVAATDAAVVRSEAGHLVALAQAAGFEAWCGYASLAPGEGARDLIAAAEAALEYARRVGPRAVVG